MKVENITYDVDHI